VTEDPRDEGVAEVVEAETSEAGGEADPPEAEQQDAGDEPAGGPEPEAQRDA